jgi:nucleoid-associated protein YgaU
MTSSEDAVRNEAASEDVDMEAEERDDSTPVTEPGKHAKPEGTPYTIPAQTFYGTRGAIEAEKAALVPADDTAVASSFGAKISGAVPWEEFIERPECRRKILVSDEYVTVIPSG